MSLLLDALKRAEQEKLAKQGRKLRGDDHAVERKLNARAVRLRQEAAILDCGRGDCGTGRRACYSVAANVPLQMSAQRQLHPVVRAVPAR